MAQETKLGWQNGVEDSEKSLGAQDYASFAFGREQLGNGSSGKEGIEGTAGIEGIEVVERPQPRSQELTNPE